MDHSKEENEFMARKAKLQIKVVPLEALVNPAKLPLLKAEIQADLKRLGMLKISHK